MGAKYDLPLQEKNVNCEWGTKCSGNCLEPERDIAGRQSRILQNVEICGTYCYIHYLILLEY
jgi:hypothetical protein